MQTLFQKSGMSENFQFKIKRVVFFQSEKWGVVKLLNQNLTRCGKFVSKPVALAKFNSKAEKFQNFLSEVWFLSCFPASDWMMISSVYVNNNLFKEENKKTKSVSFSRQMYNWKPPHVNWSLNVWGIALWQHIIFTEVTDRTLWSVKCSKSAVFLKIHIRELKKNAP